MSSIACSALLLPVATPFLVAVQGVTPVPPGQRTSHQLPGVCFSPWVAGEDPNRGATISPADLWTRMSWIAGDAEWIRTFGVDSGLELAGSYGHALGFKTAVGAWLGRDPAVNAAQISQLIALANAGDVDLAIVGSEVLLRGDLSKAELIAHIQNVRASIPASIPVTTSEVYSLYLINPDLIDAVDVVACHVYPYWEGVSLDEALPFLHCQVAKILAVAGTKPVHVTETGWPSCGPAFGAAVPSPENAARYFLEVASWARATGIRTFYFEAVNEPFKVNYEGPAGACWGYRTSAGQLKPGMGRVFRGMLLPGSWSFSFLPGGPGQPEILFTHVPPIGSFEDLEGLVLHVDPPHTRIAIYIHVGSGWWTKPYANQPLTIPECDGAWITDVTTGGIDQQADRIAGFLLPLGVQPPVLLGAPSLPPSLYQQALDSLEVAR